MLPSPTFVIRLYIGPAPSPAEVLALLAAPPGVKCGQHLRATSTVRKMIVVSRAVMQAVRREARRVELGGVCPESENLD